MGRQGRMKRPERNKFFCVSAKMLMSKFAL